MSEREGTTQSTLDLDSSVTVSAYAVAAPGDTDTVVHNLQTRQNYRLNDIGTRIWELLEGGVTVRSIVATIEAEYAMPDTVGPEQVQTDVLSVVTALSEYGLVEMAPRAASGDVGS
jgi:hypothetical protein